jgi:hypothetical protein
MHWLDKKIGSLLQASEASQELVAALKLVSRTVELIDEELKGNTKLKARAYYCGYQLALAADGEVESEDLLLKMYEQAVLTVGEDGDVFSSLGICLVEEEGENYPGKGGGNSPRSSDMKASGISVGFSATSPSRAEKLKERFRESSKQGGNTLNKTELMKLLRHGRPDIQDADVALLFDLLQADASGRISFDDLVDLLYHGRADA